MTSSRNTISFYLGEKRIDEKLDQHSFAQLSLLDYLREQHGLLSVKEGCGVGDCGACTVVLASPRPDGSINYQAVNACLLPLPMIHSRQVITAEHLGQPGSLHPVQQALVKMHGSQCGFCTPGLVMTIFAMLRNGEKYHNKELRKALSGNLCRCTGYQSILDAARYVLNTAPADGFSKSAKDISNGLFNILKDRRSMRMEIDGMEYLKVFTLTEALRLKKEEPDSLILSGATDLSLELKKGIAGNKILDISALDSLHELRYNEGYMEIGSLVSLEEVRQFCHSALPALTDILDVFASRQIRNLSTIAGNVATASPVGDFIPPLLCLGTEVELNSAENKRRMPLESFITGYRETQIREDEIIARFRIPLPGPDYKTRVYKISRRREVDISTLSACFCAEFRKDYVCDIRIAYGGMSFAARRVKEVEAFLTGKPWKQETIAQGSAMIRSLLQPISDVRGHAGTRSLIAGNLLTRFFIDTTGHLDSQIITDENP